MVHKDTSVNPDSRPLPPGWNEHYDFARQVWYYVYLNGSQPKVSLKHPVELLAPRPPLPQVNPPSDPPPKFSEKNNSNLSFAQQLYASALSKNAPASASGNARSPRLTSSLPTPPPTNSPPPRWSPPTIPVPPISTLNTMDDVKPSNDFYNSVISTRQPRLPSYQASLPDRQSVYHHRSSTMPTGSTSTPSGVRQIVTTAKPPTLHHSKSISSLPTTNPRASSGMNLQQASLGASAHIIHSAPLTPVRHARQSRRPSTASGASTSSLPLSTYPAPPTSPTLSSHSSSGSSGGKLLADVGKTIVTVLGKAALQSAGQAIKAQFFGADTVSDIVTSFTDVATSQLGLGIPQVEAVLQGSITADYQAVINALLQLQHRPNLQPQQPSRPIDYAALISKLQKAQEMANAQLQQLQLLAQQQQAQNKPPSLNQAPLSPSSSTWSIPLYQPQNSAYPAMQSLSPHHSQQSFAQSSVAGQQNLSHAQQVLTNQLHHLQQQQMQSQEAQFQQALNAQQAQLDAQTSLYQNMLSGQDQAWQQSPSLTDSSQVPVDVTSIFGVPYGLSPLNEEDPPSFDPNTLYEQAAGFNAFSPSDDNNALANLLGNLDSMIPSDTSGITDTTMANFGSSIDVNALVSSWGSNS